MSDRRDEDSILAIAGVSEREWVGLLDRAAEAGLLTRNAPGGASAMYRVHPALPWYFREQFLKAYGDPDADDPRARQVVRAYVDAVGVLGSILHSEFQAGTQVMLYGMGLEEENLLHARRLARRHGWWRGVTSAMQGLRNLYDATGRRAEWRRLVEEATPDFVDADTDKPIRGREEDWSLITDYRVGILQEERDWETAERLQRRHVDWTYEHAQPLLGRDVDGLGAEERHSIRRYGLSLSRLSQIQREQGSAECVVGFTEAYEVYQKFGFRQHAAGTAFGLGHAYRDVEKIRDLDEASRWYRVGLDLTPDSDRRGRGKLYNQLVLHHGSSANALVPRRVLVQPTGG